VLSLDSSLLKEIIETANELQEWVQDVDGLSCFPIVSVTLAQDTVSILIGDICVYSDEVWSDDEMSLLDYCKDIYLDEIEVYTRIFNAFKNQEKGKE
jgi:hypothetical protein